MMILGFTGKRGCGKDTAAIFLQREYGFRMLDFTRDVLAPLLVKQGREVTRENLILLAMEGRKKSHDGMWAEKLSDIISKSPGNDYVISGIRFRGEVGVFRSRFGDSFRLVAISCSDRNRYERVRKRGTKGESGISFSRFMEIEKKPTEKAIAETMGLADHTVENDGSLEEFHRHLVALVKTLKRYRQ